MKVELFCICESASRDPNGRMELRGVHSAVVFSSFPATITDFTLAGRFRFGLDELGTHRLKLEMRREDGSLGGSPFAQEFEVKQESDFPFAWCPCLINFPEIRVLTPAVFHFHLFIDEEPVSTCVLIAAQVLPPSRSA
jgi:hypothetical protein